MVEKKKTVEKKVADKSTEKKSAEEKEVKIPEKFQKLVLEIEKMSVLELSELVKILEEKFGVSAAAPVMAGPAVAGGGAEGSTEAVEEKSEFDIEVTSSGDSKINVIKAVREITGLGLKDSKDLVDAAPKVIKEKVAKAEAEETKKKLEEAGATVTLK